MRNTPMTKPIFRTLTIAAIALVGLGGTAYFALGQLQPVADTPQKTAAAPLRPSYIVPVRAPTPAELEQRRALAEASSTPRSIDLTPRATIEIAEVAPVTAGPRAKTTSDVNVRSGPSTETTTLSVASAGIEVLVVGQQDGWTRVTLPDGATGWIATRFLNQ